MRHKGRVAAHIGHHGRHRGADLLGGAGQPGQLVAAALHQAQAQIALDQLVHGLAHLGQVLGEAGVESQQQVGRHQHTHAAEPGHAHAAGAPQGVLRQHRHRRGHQYRRQQHDLAAQAQAPHQPQAG